MDKNNDLFKLLQDDNFKYAFNQFKAERLGNDVSEIDKEKGRYFDLVSQFVPEENRELVSTLDELIGASLAEHEDSAYQKGLKDGVLLLLQIMK